jgi:polyferredoxin
MLRREFLKQFLGKDINDPLQVGLDIDGVSRATVSVQALAEGVRVASRRMAGEVLGLEVRAGEEARALAWLRLSALAGLFLYALAGFWLLRRHPRWQRLRDASLLLGLLVLGLWQASPMSVLHVLNLLLLRVSAEPLLWVLLLGVALTVLVSAGRLYCGWLCPFGAVAEFVARLLPGRAWPIERTEEERLRRLKYPLLWLAALAVLLTGRTEFALYEVYVGLFSFSANPALWALVALSVLLNPWAWRLWCRWLCPVGAALALLSRNDPDRYPSSPLCPMGNAPRPEGAECIRCMRCYTPKRPMISRSNEG